MPLTKSGRKALVSFKKQYGKRGEEVFYKSINKGVSGSSKWHTKTKGSYSKKAVEYAIKKNKS